MYRCKSLCPSLLGFGLDGTEQMDPREVFELWVCDLLPELPSFLFGSADSTQYVCLCLNDISIM